MRKIRKGVSGIRKLECGRRKIGKGAASMALGAKAENGIFPLL